MITRSSILFVMLLAVSVDASAYYYYVCDGNPVEWADDNQTLRAHAGSFPNGALQQALQVQIDRFNFNPSKLRLEVVFGDNDVGFDNGQNEIWFTPSQSILTGHPGHTRTRYQCTHSKSELKEADVLLQGDPDKIDWVVSDDRAPLSAYGGTGTALRNAIMHELGHVGGLLHTLETYGVMGDARQHNNTNGSKSRTYLGEDGGNGLVDLYGIASGDIQDLAVSHWKFLSAGDDPIDDYSTHTRTRVYNLAGNVIQNTETVNGEKRYRVQKGQTIKVEFTYENNGKSTLYVNVAYYLSGNNTISTADLPLGTRVLHLGRNTVYTTTTTVTIPNWIPSGYYYVGAIIDSNNLIAEKSGANNASYVGIRVMPDNNNI